MDPQPPLPPRPQASRRLYQPLTFHNFEFRILTLLDREDNDGMIHCSLDNHYLGDPPEYRALSYCWGDASITEPVNVNGYTMQITTNLENALRKLKSKNVTTIWVDALCINQEDLMERGIQVSRMGLIYSKALEVVAWIGEEAQDSNIAMDQLVGIQPCTLDESPDNPIWSLLRRPFWERIWIIQEISKAREVQILCGDREISWSQLKEKFSLIEPLLPSEVRTLDSFRSRERTPLRGHSVLSRMNLSRALSKTTDFVSSDERDKIYALLGLTSDGPEIVFAPNYINTVEEVYYRTIRDIVSANQTLSYLVRESSLDTLLPRRKPIWADLTAGVPGWMVQLTSQGVRDIGGFLVLSSLPVKDRKSFSQDNYPSLSLQGLSAMGFIFDSVETVTSSFPRKFGSPGRHHEFSAATSNQLVSRPVIDNNFTIVESGLSGNGSHNSIATDNSSNLSRADGATLKASYVLKSIWRALISKECWGRKENLPIMRFDHVRTSYAFTHLCMRSNWEYVNSPSSDEDHFSNWVYQNKDLVYFEKTLQQWVEEYANTVAYSKKYRMSSLLVKISSKAVNWRLQPVEDDVRGFIAAISAAAKANIRLAVTTNSMLVLVPPQAEIGHVIGIIQHSNVAVVLKKYGDSYRYIGEAIYPIRTFRPIYPQSDQWDWWETEVIRSRIALPTTENGKQWSMLHIL